MLCRYQCIHTSPLLGQILNVAYGRPPAGRAASTVFEQEQQAGAASSLGSAKLR